MEKTYLYQHNEIKSLEKETSLDITEKQLPILYQDPAIFFTYRLANAFPGVKGLKWFNNSKEAVQRLQILLEDPISFKADGKHYCEPIWYFRGDNCFSIQDFKVIKDFKILIEFNEISINRIAVFSDSLYERNFIYVEAKPEDTIDLYKTSSEEINKQIDKYAYASEEYALLNGISITKAEYDDGAAVINGNLVDATNSQLRIRYLSKYNFIISAKTSIYNSSKFHNVSKEYLDGILRGNLTLNEYIHELNSLAKSN